jgi:uncharacterized membrane protein (DUF485 family)
MLSTEGAGVEQERGDSTGSNTIDWVCTAFAVLAFFAYILVIAFIPDAFRKPVASNTLISVGIASGAALTVFLVVLAGVYAWLRNRYPNL